MFNGDSDVNSKFYVNILTKFYITTNFTGGHL